MSYEEKRNKMIEKSRLRRENEKIVTKKFSFESGAEDATLTAQLHYNSIDFNIFRKGTSQVRGKEVSYGLNKEEVQELKSYLEEALQNWDEWNKLDI